MYPNASLDHCWLDDTIYLGGKSGWCLAFSWEAFFCHTCSYQQQRSLIRERKVLFCMVFGFLSMFSLIRLFSFPLILLYTQLCLYRSFTIRNLLGLQIIAINCPLGHTYRYKVQKYPIHSITTANTFPHYCSIAVF